jgi:hypothetical protein
MVFVEGWYIQPKIIVRVGVSGNGASLPTTFISEQLLNGFTGI